MLWFRIHQRVLLRMALALWVLAFGVAASHGCLAYPQHDAAGSHASLSTAAHDQSHRLHATGCLQHCEDSSVALSVSPGHVSLDQVAWVVLLILPILLLPVVIPSRFGALALHLPPPRLPPARLRFVRFND